MIDNRLHEAQEQLKIANRILSDDYGIGQAQDSENVPTEPKQVEPPVQDNGGNIAKQDNRIMQIRDIALQGLQDYAHNVDTEQYQFYKKIWLMCDKAVSEKDSVGSENND